MNLIKELEKISNENFSHESILESMEEEKLQLEKKQHIIHVLKIARDIDNYINLKNFELCNIGGFELDCYENTTEKICSISFNFYHNDGEMILHENMKKEYPEILQRFREIFNGDKFKSLKDLSVKKDFLSENFIESSCEEVDLAEGAGEVLINMLLNKELKSILYYSKLQLDLENKKEPNKKLKI